jgi:hypothetical protein
MNAHGFRSSGILEHPKAEGASGVLRPLSKIFKTEGTDNNDIFYSRTIP